jgi:hypothetical protein
MLRGDQRWSVAVVQYRFRHAAEDRALDGIEPSGAADDQRRVKLVGDLNDRQPDGHLGLFGTSCHAPASFAPGARTLLGGLPGSRLLTPVKVPLIGDVRRTQPGIETAGHQSHRDGLPDGQGDRVARREQLGSGLERRSRTV